MPATDPIERYLANPDPGAANGGQRTTPNAPTHADSLTRDTFAAAEIARLEEQRLAALEARVEADFGAGRHGELVAELQRLVVEHPLRERLHGQLMLALYRAGRQADALEAFRQARAVLVEALGIEPGPELRQLHRAILVQDPGLAARPARV